MDQLHLLLDSSNQLIEEIKSLNFDQLNTKPAPNKWSISQICDHLYLTEQVVAKAIEYGVKGKDYELVAPKPIHILSDRTQNFDSPEITQPTEDPFEVDTLLNLLVNSRETLLNLLRSIDDPSSLTKKAANHPAFGELSLNQWIDLLYLHEQRHIEQIKEVKSAKYD